MPTSWRMLRLAHVQTRQLESRSSRKQPPGKLRCPGWRKGRWSDGLSISSFTRPEFWVLRKPAGSSCGGEPKVVVISPDGQKALLPRGPHYFQVLRTLRRVMESMSVGKAKIGDSKTSRPSKATFGLFVKPRMCILTDFLWRRKQLKVCIDIKSNVGSHSATQSEVPFVLGFIILYKVGPDFAQDCNLHGHNTMRK